MVTTITLKEKVKQLEDRLNQEKKKLRLKINKERLIETKKQRALDTRRKILIGSFFLAKNQPLPNEFYQEYLKEFDQLAFAECYPPEHIANLKTKLAEKKAKVKNG